MTRGALPARFGHSLLDILRVDAAGQRFLGDGLIELGAASGQKHRAEVGPFLRDGFPAEIEDKAKVTSMAENWEKKHGFLLTGEKRVDKILVSGCKVGRQSCQF